MFPYTLRKILKAMEMKGFDPVQKPYMLHLVGIRMPGNANTFNDWFTMFRKEMRMQAQIPAWEFRAFHCTTDPGLYWRLNPMNVEGTAILCPGMHEKLWTIGLHKGQYPALVQYGKARVWRDNDKDEVLDPGPTVSGYYGINCHRAKAKATSTIVDKWSAACQVIADSKDDDVKMEWANTQVERTGIETFDYMLLEDTDLNFLNV